VLICRSIHPSLPIHLLVQDITQQLGSDSLGRRSSAVASEYSRRHSIGVPALQAGGAATSTTSSPRDSLPAASWQGEVRSSSARTCTVHRCSAGTGMRVFCPW
jgi:hypothetical protein